MRGGAVFLAMQVLEIPAGGRGFPLVMSNHQYNPLLNTIVFTIQQHLLFVSHSRPQAIQRPVHGVYDTYHPDIIHIMPMPPISALQFSGEVSEEESMTALAIGVRMI